MVLGNHFVKKREVDSAAVEVESPSVEEALAMAVLTAVGVENLFVVKEMEFDPGVLVVGNSSAEEEALLGVV